MALRVLLADESSTIKKAIQMALSQYAVEIKSVPSGLDVLAVAHTFKPDIILADVLLNKKSGYEVCYELKNDPGTQKIPVVLMWSSFIQIDNDQVAQVKADDTLEKPFDTKTLQAIVDKFVPKVAKFPLKGILTHPPLPDFTESGTFVRQKNSVTTDVLSEVYNINTTPPINEDADDFSFSPPTSLFPKDELSQPNANKTKEKPTDPSEDWTSASSDQFVVETENYGDFEEVIVVNSKNNSTVPDLKKRIQMQVNTYLEDAPLTKDKATANKNNVASTLASPSTQSSTLTTFDEQLLKEEIRQLAERICWQIIPDITEKVVREELNKLLQGLEKNT